MNNRFKFRAWYKPLFDEESPHYVYDVEQIYDGFINKGHCELGWVSSFGSLLDSDEYIIEQCTGLKDKNGKLIYEGDIVEIMVWDDIEEDMVETKGKVYWSKEDASFLIYVSFDEEYPLYGQEIKVIGNIHENADLLEVEND